MSFKQNINRVLNGLVRKSYWFNTIMFPDCDKFWNHKDFNIDVVNLGSTSGLNAFNYEDLPLKGYNWALGRNPLVADFEVLNNYYSYLNPQRSTVIICLCPFSSLSGSYNYLDDKYYTILNVSSIPNGSIRKRAEVLQIKKNPIKYYPLFELIRSLKSLITINKDNCLSESQMRADAVKWMSNWKKEFSIEDFSYPLSLVNQDGIEDAAKILNKMIGYCKERNIRPVLIIPPVYHTLGDLITSEIHNKIINPLIERLEDKTVWYHNYMEDEDFSNNIILFQNSFLLNKKGAKLFTNKVLKDIGLVP